MAGGGSPEGAAKAASRLVEQGVNALVSFGFAGGLDPALCAGTVVVPNAILSRDILYATEPALAARFGGLTGHRLMAGTSIAADATTKTRLYATTQAHVIDLESGSVAHVAQAYGLPFIAIRAISDPAERDLPPAALLALDPHGRLKSFHVLGSLLRQPGQLSALLRLARDAARARRALLRLTQESRLRTRQ